MSSTKQKITTRMLKHVIEEVNGYFECNKIDASMCSLWIKRHDAL
jgi:hypothetical protein